MPFKKDTFSASDDRNQSFFSGPNRQVGGINRANVLALVLLLAMPSVSSLLSVIWFRLLREEPEKTQRFRNWLNISKSCFELSWERNEGT
jgi:hypothetical protein